MTSVINLGLVKAIQVALTPPTNINQLWYDDNVGIKILKYYNTFTSTWESIIPPAPGTAAWGSISTGTGIPSQTDLVSYLNGNYLKLSGGTMLGNIVMSNGIFLSGTSTITPSFGSLTYSNTISLSEFHTGVKGMVLKTIKNSNTAAFTSISTGEFIDIRASSSVGVVSVISIDPAQTQIFTQGAGGFSSVGIYTPVQVQFSVSGTNATNLRLTSTELSLRTNLANGFALLKGTNLTIDRTFEFPNKDGTFAMLSDIVGGTVTASNGLTATGINITLGGTLLNDTLIDGSFILNYGSVTPLSEFVIQTSSAIELIDINSGIETAATISASGVQLVQIDTSTNHVAQLYITSENSLYGWSDGSATISNVLVNFNGIGIQTQYSQINAAYLKSDILTTNRTFQFPDKNGTFAMLSDIVGYVYLRGNVTTLNSVRIGINGTNVTLQNYDGTTWNDVTIIGGPI